ncbi:MAG: hypothetical protein CBE11_02035 [Rickettsiales bacterium TMED251]|nr:MAG: hypothetical protein CBE11_02035 [Rickettsiales bacterium TMED251]
MKFLNHFSLSKDLRDSKIIEKELSKLTKKNNYNFKIFFLIDDNVVTCKDVVFFYETNNIYSDLLEKNNFAYIGKKAKTIFLSSFVSKEKLSFLNKSNILEYRNIREVLFSNNREISSLVSSGFQLMQWKKDNKFCGKCGFKNRFLSFENSMICSNQKCLKRIFPRINPTVIVNITYRDKILLARNRNWKKNLYSCLAGFCEFNESAEEAVERESFEETGVILKEIEYVFSQTWPFQNNLMLGFQAKAKKSEIIIDKHELEDARWFSYRDLVFSVNNKKLILPKKHSIARNLIFLWEERFKN